MKRVLRVLLATVVTVVVVMVVVPMFLGDKIGEIVKREAGKLVDARIEFSKLDVSLFRHFPQASLEITDLDVSGVGAFEGHSLVAAERIELAVDLWSVFGDSFEVEKVWLRRPSISALVLANGKANWDIMKESDEEPAGGGPNLLMYNFPTGLEANKTYAAFAVRTTTDGRVIKSAPVVFTTIA